MFQLKCIWNICQAPGNGNEVRNPIPEADSKILDNGACPRSQELSSLSPKSQSPNPKSRPKGLWLTLKSHGPPYAIKIWYFCANAYL